MLTVIGTCSRRRWWRIPSPACSWPGRDFFFGLLLGTMMLPEIITLIPMFLEFRTLGWTKPGMALGVLPLNYPAADRALLAGAGARSTSS